MTGYTTREVAEIVGLPAARVRVWARAGLPDARREPGKRWRYSFRDVVLLRVVRDLVAAGVGPGRVRRALAELPGQLPEGRPLSAVRIVAAGGRVLVTDGGATWDPESRQVQLDLEVADLARAAEPFAARIASEARNAGRGLDADDWYNVGVDLEAVSIQEAMRAYGEALTRDPGHARANINMGRILHEAGDPMAAAERYRRALATDPTHAVAAYNLAVALEDVGDLHGAIGMYNRAIRLDAERADAHFNLARIYERAGEPEKAWSHMARFRLLIGRAGT